MCPIMYEELLWRKFNTEEETYEAIEKEKEEILKDMKEEWKERGLEKECKWNNKANLAKVRIVPKNSDVTRQRPVVSYQDFGGKRLGRYVARALGVMIKWIKDIGRVQIWIKQMN